MRYAFCAQGDIESVASKSAKELTVMFEHLSGSDAYRKDYEEYEQKKAAAEEQTSILFSRKKSIVADRKQKKEQKDEAEKHLKLQKELVNSYLSLPAMPAPSLTASTFSACL